MEERAAYDVCTRQRRPNGGFSGCVGMPDYGAAGIVGRRSQAGPGGRVEARCGALGEEGVRVVGAPGGGVQEGVVGYVEGREIREGGEIIFQLGGIAVDGGC